MDEIIETNSGAPEVNSNGEGINTQDSFTHKKVYEVSVLFVPELTPEELSQEVESVKNKLTSLEAEIISEGKPVHIRLAYTVEKHINNKIRRADFAHFYWIKFEVTPTQIKKIENYLKLDLAEKVLRYLLIKAVRENTVLTELTEARLADIKNDELIDEVLSTDLQKETDLEKMDADNTITDLGGDEALKTFEDIEKTMIGEEDGEILKTIEEPQK